MRLRAPRIPPLPPSQWDDETSQMMANLKREGQVFNIFATLARHPALLRRWTVFGAHILGKSTLPARERELVILRMGWLCQAGYEWGHHVAIGKAAGLTVAEIQRVKEGPDAPGWNALEKALLRAVDELNRDTFISDPTWKILSEHLNTQQLFDVIFTAGQYKMVSMALNSVGVQLEAGYEGLSGPSA